MGFKITPLRRIWVPTQVKCYSGYKGEEFPISFLEGKNWHKVLSIVDRWYDPDASYFKVQSEESRTFLLRWDLIRDEWALMVLP